LSMVAPQWSGSRCVPEGVRIEPDPITAVATPPWSAA